MEAGDAELQKILLCDLEQLKEVFEYPDLGRAFQHWVADYVLGLSDDDIEDELKGALGRDCGIDYFNVNEDGRIVEIVQAKFSEDFGANIPHSELDAFFQVPDKLKHNVGVGSGFEERHRRYIGAIDRDFEVKLYLIVAGRLSDINIQEIKLAESKLPPNIKFELLESEDLLGLVGNRNSQACKMKLVDDESFISTQADGQVKKVVATVSAKELKKIYDFIKPTTLFSMNPRHFLGKGSVAKGIVKTLEDEPEKIWHYNNGISAVCDDFSHDRESNTLTIHNLKIVNGCQTVTTIAKYKGVIPDDATLMIRISKVDDPEFLKNISTYTNTQNRIHASDLWSGHKSLEKLDKKFEQYCGRFFWERKKGSLNSMDRKESLPYRKAKLKKLRVIENVTAARLKMAFHLELPHMSIQVSEAKIFSDDYVDSPRGRMHLFSEIYDKVEPIDFILPNIFWYLLNKLKARTDKNTSHGMLLHVRIGQYYIMAVIGKLLRSMNPGSRDRFTQMIVDSVDSDIDVLYELEGKLEPLAKGIAAELETVLSNNEQRLTDYAPTGLRDALKKEPVFKSLYTKREKYMTVHSEKQDLFIQDLEALCARHANSDL